MGQPPARTWHCRYPLFVHGGAMPFSCGMAVSELFPIRAGGREAKGIQHYHGLQGHGCLLWGRDGDPAARGGGVVLTHREILSEDRGAFCAQAPLGCEPLLCVLQPCTPSSSQLGPPHHQCPHHTRGCGVSAGPAWCPQRPSTEQKAKKIFKNSKTKQDRPLMLEQWLSGLELKIEIYGYTVQMRGGRGLYTWDRLCTRSQRAAALPVTRFVKKKKKK